MEVAVSATKSSWRNTVSSTPCPALIDFSPCIPLQPNIYIYLFVCYLGLASPLTSWTFCLYLFSSTFFVPTPHPSFQGAGYMWPGWMAVSSALSSTPFGFTECLTHCPVSNTCTRIISNPPLLYPTPKAISLQRGSSTTTATPPHPTMGTQAHRHSDPTPIFFFS